MIELTFLKELILTLFRMGFSRTAHGYVVPKSLPPTLKSVTSSTMMKLDTVIACLKKIQKIHESHDTPLELC